MTTTKTSAPPAIWTAFAQQGRWKNWVLVGQLAVIFALLVMCFELATRPADVVVVEADGTGAYLPASVASSALQDWLRSQRNRASDITIRAFSERFVRLMTAVNSTTFDEAFDEATSMMITPLREKLRLEAESQKLLETYRLAGIRTTLDFDALEVVERRDSKTHVRARVRRHKEKLVGGMASDDVLQIDLVVVDVPRSRLHPDGLEVLDWRSGPYTPPAAPAAPTPSETP